MIPFTTERVPDMEYYDDYISESEEQELLQGIQQHPNAWKTLNNRSLQNWGGLPHLKGMLETKLPSFLQPLLNKLLSTSIFAQPTSPNHVLINRYLPGQGIDAHVDGPVYKPTAAIISLLSPLLMHFFVRHSTPDSDSTSSSAETIPSNPLCSILLRPRSLLVLKGFAYHNVYHAILPVTHDYIDQSLVVNANVDEVNTTIDRKERISLTVRASCHTLKNPLLRSFGRNKGLKR